MIREASILLLLVGPCGTPEKPVAPQPARAPFQGCLRLPPDLPSLRTPEALDEDRKAVRLLYLDCAERARRNAAAYPRGESR